MSCHVHLMNCNYMYYMLCGLVTSTISAIEHVTSVCKSYVIHVIHDVIIWKPDHLKISWGILEYPGIPVLILGYPRISQDIWKQ